MRFSFLSLLVLGAVSAGLVRADDILANGDFADGSAHWDGDRITNTDSNNLVIPLKHDNWAKISQTFNTRETCLKLSVTFSLSDDCTLLPKNGPYHFYLSDAVVMDVTGLRTLQTMARLPQGGFLAFVVDPPSNTVNSSLLRSIASTDSQSALGFFYHLVAHEEKTFYLAFPPGAGTVTLSHVALEPAPDGPSSVTAEAESPSP